MKKSGLFLAFISAVTAQAGMSAPQFATVQADQSSYTIGQSASITIGILIQPSNLNEEIVVLPTLAGAPVDITEFSSSEWGLVTPALMPTGNVVFEADIYIQNTERANSLQSSVTFYQQEIAQLQVQIANTNDPGTIATLQAQVNRDTGLIGDLKTQLTQGRRLVEADQLTLSVSPNSNFTPMQINCGGTQYTGSDATVWVADEDFTSGQAYTVSSSITGTSDPTLYQTERYGTNFGYSFSVPNGNYSVELLFTENYWTAAGQRVFNTSINGTQVLSNFDIFATAGGADVALNRAFPVTVTGGQIQIQFSAITDNAVISGIKIVQTSRSKSMERSSERLPLDGGSFYLDADRSNRIYSVGDTATFFVKLETPFTGPDGPQEVVVQPTLDGTAIGVTSSSPAQVSFVAPAFTSAQLGAGTFTAQVYVRSQSRSDALRGAIANGNAMKGQWIAKKKAATSAIEHAHDQDKINELTTLVGDFENELQELLSLVGTQTLDFTVQSAKHLSPLSSEFSELALLLITADHSNLLYNSGEQANFVLSSGATPSDPAFHAEAQVSFPGLPHPVILPLEKDPVSFVTPLLSQGQSTLTAALHWVDRTRLKSDEKQLKEIARDLAFWQADIAQTSDPAQIAQDNQMITQLNTAQANVTADLSTADSLVETDTVQITAE